MFSVQPQGWECPATHPGARVVLFLALLDWAIFSSPPLLYSSSPPQASPQPGNLPHGPTSLPSVNLWVPPVDPLVLPPNLSHLFPPPKLPIPNLSYDSQEQWTIVHTTPGLCTFTWLKVSHMNIARMRWMTVLTQNVRIMRRVWVGIWSHPRGGSEDSSLADWYLVSWDGKLKTLWVSDWLWGSCRNEELGQTSVLASKTPIRFEGTALTAGRNMYVRGKDPTARVLADCFSLKWFFFY